MSELENNKPSQPMQQRPAAPVRPEPQRPAQPEPQKSAAQPAKAEAETKPDGAKPDAKTAKQTKEPIVDNTNLAVAQNSLEVDELSQRRLRKIRNATYAMAAIALLLVVALIVIILLPKNSDTEAKYNLTIDSAPTVLSVTHVLSPQDSKGNLVKFNKDLTLQFGEESEFAGYACFALKLKFYDEEGNDLTNKMYFKFDESRASEIYNIASIKSPTLGGIENSDINEPNNQVYVDLASNEYIFFNPIIRKGDEPYILMNGFLCKELALLDQEISVEITLYAFDAQSLQITSQGIVLEDGSTIPAEEGWKTEVQKNI